MINRNTRNQNTKADKENAMDNYNEIANMYDDFVVSKIKTHIDEAAKNIQEEISHNDILLKKTEDNLENFITEKIFGTEESDERSLLDEVLDISNNSDSLLVGKDGILEKINNLSDNLNEISQIIPESENNIQKKIGSTEVIFKEYAEQLKESNENLNGKISDGSKENNEKIERLAGDIASLNSLLDGFRDKIISEISSVSKTNEKSFEAITSLIMNEHNKTITDIKTDINNTNESLNRFYAQIDSIKKMQNDNMESISKLNKKIENENNNLKKMIYFLFSLESVSLIGIIVMIIIQFMVK